MGDEILTTKTNTSAQKMAHLLKNCGIAASVERLPAALSKQGCGYSVHIEKSSHNTAIECLRKGNLLPGKIYIKEYDGYREVAK